jgi:hypothetical protein
LAPVAVGHGARPTLGIISRDPDRDIIANAERMFLSANRRPLHRNMR